VEQIFSRAGGLTDPNIDQDYLATLVVVGGPGRLQEEGIQAEL
jgi:hypothetical protein